LLGIAGAGPASGRALGRVPLSGGLLLFFLIALFCTYLLAGLSFGGVSISDPQNGDDRNSCPPSISAG